MSNHSWLTFDCFGTLVDWDRGISQSAELLFPGRGREVLTAYGRQERELRHDSIFHRYREVLNLGLQRACADLELSLNGDDADFLAQTIPYWPVFDDVRDTLSLLRRKGWRLALLTNCDRDIIGQTRRRLSVPIDAVVTAEDVQAYKPAHAHFTAFAESFDPSSKDWIHVAQSHEIDVRPASELGLRCIWINRTYDRDDPSLAAAVLEGLSDLPDALETLLQR